MKLKTCRVKKLYKGHVSIRDYLVERAIEANIGILVKYQDWEMTVPLELLKERFQLHQQQFESKYGTQNYKLFDFVFIPDYANEEAIKSAQKGEKGVH